MAKQVINNGETGLVVRTKINENFTEVYDKNDQQDTAISGKSDSDHNHDGVYELKNVNIQQHISNTDNPHSVNKADVGLSNVDNTADADKPVSTIQQSALDGKSPTTHNHNGVYEPADPDIQTHIHSPHAPSDANNYVHPSSHPSTMITGLGTAATKNVGISASQIVQLDSNAKLPAIDGSQLTNVTSLTQNQTDALDGANSPSSTNVIATMNDLGGLGDGDMNASVYDPSSKNSDAFSMDNMDETATKKIMSSGERDAIAANTLKDGITSQQASDISSNNAHRASTDNPHGVDKDDINLGNVDNTSDVDKPVSTSQQTALNGKSNTGHQHNLSEITDSGTAAALNVGTSANNVVQLDTNAKLPAIDGSQLTNLSSAPSNLDDLNDVNVSSPNDKDVLTWDNVNSEWISSASSGGGGRSGVTSQVVSSDVVFVEPSDLVQIIESSNAIGITLPDATTLTVGLIYELCLKGSGSFRIKDNSGTVLWFLFGKNYSIYLVDNSTANGTWEISPDKDVGVYDFTTDADNVLDPGTWADPYSKYFDVGHSRDDFYLLIHFRPNQSNRHQIVGFKRLSDGTMDAGNGYDIDTTAYQEHLTLAIVNGKYCIVTYVGGGVIKMRIGETTWKYTQYSTAFGTVKNIYDPDSTDQHGESRTAILSETSAVTLLRNVDTSEFIAMPIILDLPNKLITTDTPITLTGGASRYAVDLIKTDDGYLIGATSNSSSLKPNFYLLSVSGTTVSQDAALLESGNFGIYLVKLAQVAPYRILAVMADSGNTLSAMLLQYNGDPSELSVVRTLTNFVALPDLDPTNAGDVSQLQIERLAGDHSRVRIYVYDTNNNRTYFATMTVSDDDIIGVENGAMYLSNAVEGGGFANDPNNDEQCFVANYTSTTEIAGRIIDCPR